MAERMLNILIVEDQVSDFVLLSDYLNQVFKNPQMVYCRQLQNAAAISASVVFDVLITSADVALPADKESFTAILQQPDAPAVVLLTASFNEGISLGWIAAGVQDCIPKENLNSRILYKSVTYAIARRMKNLLVTASVQPYKNLFAQNPLPVVVYELDNKKVVLANQAAEDFYGYTESELLQLQFADLQLENELKTSIFTGQKQHRTKSGKLILVEVFGNLVQFNHKICRQMLMVQAKPGTLQPENKEETQQLLLLQSAISNSADGVIITKNISGDFCTSEVVFSNAAFNRLTGFTATAILGQKPEQLHKKYPVKEVSDLPATAFETRLVDYQHNTEIWVDYSVSPVTGENAEITHFVAVYRDVSERKKMEAENQNLLQNMAQTNQELKQFSYVISHNLRAPLANLTGLLSLLDMETIEDADTLELIEAVKSSTNKLNVTVNDIIEVLMIKMEDGQLTEQLSFAESWEQVRSSLSYLVETADAQIVADFTETPAVMFTKSYLESILVNFLSNALKYKSDDRRLIINLKTYEEQGYAVLVFEDNGIGIDMNRYGDQVFGLYKRFNNKAEGKGLGLYIVQAQITAMGGKVSVKSELNKGTRFTVYFKK